MSNNNSNISSELLQGYQGLVCFVLEEIIIESGLLNKALVCIQKEGFSVYDAILLNGISKKSIAERKGGDPAALIIGLDVYPISPSADEANDYPGITNKRILKVGLIQEKLKEHSTESKLQNRYLYCSSNEIEALEYLSLAGVHETKIKEWLISCNESFRTKERVIKDISAASRRAKVELIEYNGGRAIKKTFKPGKEVYLKNEIEAYTILKDLKEMPRLLKTEQNYIITEYIENARPLESISINILMKCLKVLKQIHAYGYSLIDFQPENFIIDKKNNIFLIDFEFFYKYRKKPDFYESYDLVGCPKDFDILYMPGYVSKKTGQYNFFWFEKTYLRYDELPNINRFDSRIKVLIRRAKKKVSGMLR